MSWRYRRTISDTEFVIDLRNNPDQDSSPSNAGHDDTLVSMKVIFKALTDPPRLPTKALFGR
ncbi:hypothetical protein JNB84_22380 [Rhizobium pusense]|uniref:hypothetical protein n=1 Tax=Agrobacterium pusense TaxID=648995 RepID=UPI001C6F1473|nr:hypothetical protein [Agrobacterium pusense]MBW9080714.1 hypothetical protein [Agrobacterium pusense]